MSNLQFLNMPVLSRRFVGKIQTAQTVRISVKTDIAEVLSVGVDSAVNSYEASRGEASFYGKTNIKFVYSDGAGVLSSGYNADFTATIYADALDTDSKLTFEVTTLDSKVDVNANTATLSLLLEVSAYAYVADSVIYLADGDDAYCQSENVEFLQSADALNLPFTVDTDLTASRDISTVLLAESTLCATEYTCSDGVLRVSGDAFVRLTYISQGNIVTDTLPFAFDRELDASSVLSDSQIRLRVLPKNTKVRLDISENEVNTAFSVEISATAYVEAAKVAAVDIVTDAYGADCDFVFERKSVLTTLPCGSTVAQRQLLSTLPLATGGDVITAVNVNAVVTECRSSEGQASVEGVIYATLLCSTETGVKGVPAEVPFVQTVDVDYLTAKCNCSAYACVSRFDASGGDSAVQIQAALCIFVESQRDEMRQVIVAAEQQTFDKTQLPAIEVCLAHKGETLWQLAKGMHLSEEELCAVNPELTNPLEQDVRIVVFNRI